MILCSGLDANVGRRDRLECAMFRLRGRDLWIAVPGASEERFAVVLIEAGLNCGLSVDTAQIC
jgi:hypothetical protein